MADKEEISPKTIARAKTTKRRGVAKGRHLTPAQKAEIVTLWRTGELTLEELATRFEKDVSTIKVVVKGHKKGELGEEVKKKVTEEIEKGILDDSTVYAQRVRDTKEEHYKMASAIAKLTYATIATAKKESKPLASVAGDVKTLQLAAQTLKITREERYAVLGISITDDNEDKPLPDLIVQELTADDIDELQKNQLVQDEWGDEDMLEEMESDGEEDSDEHDEEDEAP